MTTRVTITGTGTPIQTPDRAGPGVLITHGATALQFDVGRGTVMRLAAVGQKLTQLSAVLVTHHHSDHLVGLPDLLMTRWLNDVDRVGQHPLPVHAPEGEATRMVSRMLDVWKSEMEMRQKHTARPNIAEVDVRGFLASKAEVAPVAEVGAVSVRAVAVEHDPVVPAVGYRVDAPEGSVVISGDTAVCDQLEHLAEGADVLVTEAIRAEGLVGRVTDPSVLLDYHSTCEEIGAMAKRAGIGLVVMTHLVPPPGTSEDESAFAQGVRDGGYTGPVHVARDLDRIELSGKGRPPNVMDRSPS